MIKRTIITLLSTLLVANPVMATAAVHAPSDAHKTSHVVVGAGMAAVTEGDIAAGAMGAVVGEFVAQQYREKMEAEGKFDPKSKDFADTVGLGINIAKLAAACVAAVAKMDAGTASMTAGNAAANNSLAKALPAIQMTLPAANKLLSKALILALSSGVVYGSIALTQE